MLKFWKLKINRNLKAKISYNHTAHINSLIRQYITSQRYIFATFVHI